MVEPSRDAGAEPLGHHSLRLDRAANTVGCGVDGGTAGVEFQPALLNLEGHLTIEVRDARANGLRCRHRFCPLGASSSAVP